MKAHAHFDKGEEFERQQADLDPATHWAAIVATCHGAAHHLLCAGIEWAGVNHERHGHTHSYHPQLLNAAGAPDPVKAAWLDLEKLHTRVTYGAGADGVESARARTHLATIKRWAQSVHP
jgi:hypothetical protein